MKLKDIITRDKKGVKNDVVMNLRLRKSRSSKPEKEELPSHEDGCGSDMSGEAPDFRGEPADKQYW